MEEILGTFPDYVNMVQLKGTSSALLRWRDRELMFAPVIKSLSRGVAKEPKTAIVLTKCQYAFGEKLENTEKNRKKS